MCNGHQWSVLVQDCLIVCACSGQQWSVLVQDCLIVCACSGQQWSVLVQDCLDVLCEIILPRYCLASPVWSRLMTSPPGCLWTFSGLRVVRRLNRSRSWHRHCFVWQTVLSILEYVLRWFRASVRGSMLLSWGVLWWIRKGCSQWMFLPGWGQFLQCFDTVRGWQVGYSDYNNRCHLSPKVVIQNIMNMWMKNTKRISIPRGSGWSRLPWQMAINMTWWDNLEKKKRVFSLNKLHHT